MHSQIPKRPLDAVRTARCVPIFFFPAKQDQTPIPLRSRVESLERVA